MITDNILKQSENVSSIHPQSFEFVLATLLAKFEAQEKHLLVKFEIQEKQISEFKEFFKTFGKETRSELDDVKKQLDDIHKNMTELNIRFQTSEKNHSDFSKELKSLSDRVAKNETSLLKLTAYASLIASGLTALVQYGIPILLKLLNK